MAKTHGSGLLLDRFTAVEDALSEFMGTAGILKKRRDLVVHGTHLLFYLLSAGILFLLRHIDIEKT